MSSENITWQRETIRFVIRSNILHLYVVRFDHNLQKNQNCSSNSKETFLFQVVRTHKERSEAATWKQTDNLERTICPHRLSQRTIGMDKMSPTISHLFRNLCNPCMISPSTKQL